MSNHDNISQYDLVEIIQVPEKYKGVIHVGDVGTVVEKYDEENFEIECVQSDGSYRWLETLNVEYVRLKSKDPFSRWMKTSLIEKSMTRQSIILGAEIGAAFGALIGAGLGAITSTLNGILLGLVIGLVLGAVTGALTAALTVKTAGRTGGVGVGYFTGMVFGGMFGMVLGALIPTSVRMRAHTEGLPLLDAFATGRFETAILLGFLLSILDTIVGAWIGGKNQDPRNLKNE